MNLKKYFVRFLPALILLGICATLFIPRIGSPESLTQTDMEREEQAILEAHYQNIIIREKILADSKYKFSVGATSITEVWLAQLSLDELKIATWRRENGIIREYGATDSFLQKKTLEKVLKVVEQEYLGGNKNVSPGFLNNLQWRLNQAEMRLIELKNVTSDKSFQQISIGFESYPNNVDPKLLKALFEAEMRIR